MSSSAAPAAAVMLADASLEMSTAPAVRSIWRQAVHLDVAIVADKNALVSIKQDYSLRHVVDHNREERTALIQSATRKGADEADAEDGHCRARNCDRKNTRRKSEGINRTCRIGHNLHRAHSREMVGHDRQRQQNGSQRRVAPPV